MTALQSTIQDLKNKRDTVGKDITRLVKCSDSIDLMRFAGMKKEHDQLQQKISELELELVSSDTHTIA